MRGTGYTVGYTFKKGYFAMQLAKTLHERLVRRACATDGWKLNEKDHGWRVALRALLRDKRWNTDRNDIQEAMADLRARPDAWRMSVRDEDDTIILEFLEVEVWHHISDAKKADYETFWWRVDGSDGVRLIIWRMDRFGVVSPFMDEGTVHALMNVLPD